MTQLVDPLRHMSVFNPDKWGNRIVDVIGAGAVGSKVVIELAKLGIRNIRAWDFDTVAAHNVANQFFGLTDIGKLKVEALKARVLADTGIEIDARNAKVTGAEKLGHTVFLLVDSMEARREIWTKGLKLKIGTKLVIETRMGVNHGRVYVVNPTDMVSIKTYEATLTVEAKPEVSACGTSITVGPTASFLASLAVYQLIRAFAIENGSTDDELENEILFSLQPSHFETRNFKAASAKK